MPGKFFQTLKFRLTVWNTIVVLIASLLALFAVRVAMRLTIETEARALLREEATELKLAIDQLYPNQSKIVDEFERKILSHSQHDWYAALMADGETVWKSNNFSTHAEGDSPTTTTKEFTILQTSDQLVVRYAGETVDGKSIQFVLGEPTEFIRNDVWQLTKTMLLIGIGLLVVAPIGGFFLARHATGPVRQIISTTRSLNPARLDSRLVIRGSGDELDQLSIEINSFVDQISKYIKSQREFVADAAHELRSPITAIQTSVEVTLDKDRTLAEYKEELETVSEQCQQLRYLVNQLLELAETDAATPTDSFQAVDITQLIEKSINVFSGVAEEKAINIVARLDSDVEVVGDRTRLRQVINNLLDNALKFSPQGGQVEIELTDSLNGVSVVVTDSGHGVAEPHLEQIFERFFQVDKSRQRDANRGNGLGLSICKSIIELHGGSMSARNTKQGFTIQFELPRTLRG